MQDFATIHLMASKKMVNLRQATLAPSLAHLNSREPTLKATLGL
jgi:hypothetical protein